MRYSILTKHIKKYNNTTHGFFSNITLLIII